MGGDEGALGLVGGIHASLGEGLPTPGGYCFSLKFHSPEQGDGIGLFSLGRRHMTPDVAFVKFPAALRVSGLKAQNGQVPCIMTVNAGPGVVPRREEIFLLLQAATEVSGDQRQMR